MAQEVHEQLDSRSLATNGGRLTGTRVFVVWDDASAITEPIQIELGANGMPQAGDAFPGENNVFAQTLSYEPIPASNNAWRVTWGYQSGEFVGLLPSEEGYLGVHVDWIAEFALFYRVPPGLLLFDGAPTDADIGGKSIDAGGNPLSVAVKRAKLVLEETVSASSMETRAERFFDAVGARNDRPFYGSATGKLLYIGAQSSRTSVSLYSIRHEFLYDRYYHMQQVPRMNPQGRVELEVTANGSYAGWVRWIQPFEALANFNNLSENF